MIWNLHFLNSPDDCILKFRSYCINSYVASSFPLVLVRSKLKSATRKSTPYTLCPEPGAAGRNASRLQEAAGSEARDMGENHPGDFPNTMTLGASLR